MSNHTDDFNEYRQLILAHIESSNRRQDAVEDQVTEIKVAMGVLVVKVGFVVSLIVLIGGGVSTGIVKASLDAVVIGDTATLEAAGELRDALLDATRQLRPKEED